MFQQAEPDVIYDRYGRPLVRLFSNGRFISFKGDHVGYATQEGLVYNYQGKHLGWFEKGVLRDVQGNCVGYGLNPQDSPIPLLPLRHLPPLPHISKIAPIAGLRSLPHLKPIKKFMWSSIELSQFFFQ